MQMLSNVKRNCCIIGRPDIPFGYESVLEYEFNNLIAHGVTCYLFSGMGTFEALCLKVLQKLQQCYDYIPIRLVLIGSDVEPLSRFGEEFDAIYCMCRKSNPPFRATRHAIRNSRYMIYFQQTGFGGAFSDVRYGQDRGLYLINVAKSKREADKIPSASII